MLENYHLFKFVTEGKNKMIEITTVQIDQWLEVARFIIYLYLITVIIKLLKFFHVSDILFIWLVLKFEKKYDIDKGGK